jgi:hypothetical protein
MLSIAQTINVGKLATGLAINSVAKGALFGGKLAPNSPLTMAMVTSALEWGNSAGQDAEDLRGLADYAYWIYGKQGLQAQYLIGISSGGGTVVPGGGTSTLPSTIDWIVSGTASGTAPLANGESTVTFDGTGGMPDLRGYNMDFFRGGSIQVTTNPGDGSNYYSWNRVTGVFTLLGTTPSANTGEPMRISPIG